MKRLIASVLLIMSLAAIFFSTTKIKEIDTSIQESKAAYDVLRTYRSKETANTTENTHAENNAPSEEDIYVPTIVIDYESLTEVGRGTSAWLYSPGTEIDYPIMQADDYNYYLYHLPDGTYNLNGSLFIDYNNNADFSDTLTVIYGHNMRSGMMFGSLKEYKKQSYYDEHPYMYIYTQGKDYRLDLLYGCVIGESQWRERAFMYKENLSTLLTHASHNTTFTSNVRYNPGSKIVALSTCSYEFDDARYVVLGVLREATN